MRFVVSGLRFKHTKTALFDAALSSARTHAWRVPEGKDGHPFAFSLPTFLVPEVPLFSQVQATLHGTLGVNAPFVPDMYFGTGGLPVFENRAFSYSRFQDFFRSLLRLPPLGLSQEQACSFSTRSMRRFLPSIADSLQLADSDRLCLGNWSDGRKLPMPVRYSSERLESAAQARRLCLAALHHLFKHIPQPGSWLRIRAVAQLLNVLKRLTTSKLWGQGTEELPPPIVPSSPEGVPTDRPSSDEESSSGTSSSHSSIKRSPVSSFVWPESAEQLHFVRPAQGMWHVTEEQQSFLGVCTSRVFKQAGSVWANGLTAALQTHGRFCAPCLLRLPPGLRVDVQSQSTR